MIRKILVIILFLYSILPLNAQGIKGFSISFIDETVSIPFTRYTPVHPGGELGFTFKERIKENSIRRINVYAGGFYHQRVETGFYLKIEYSYTMKIKNLIGIDFPMGIGYLHTFYPGELYVQDDETGEFKEINQFGRPHALAGFGIGLSYIGSSGIQPFIKQELFIETPFVNTFPLIPHSFFKVGITVKLNSHADE